MPFYALVDTRSGDILDVVTILDHERMPSGAMAVELPAREDDVRAWLAAHGRDRGGGGNGEAYVDRDEHGDAGKGGRRRDDASDAEQFFARLDQEVVRCDLDGRRLAVLLFELAPADRPHWQEFVLGTLKSHGQEVLPCDVVARLREHLAGVLMTNCDAGDLEITAPRGRLTSLTYPHDHDAVEAVRRRKHPLLRMRR